MSFELALGTLQAPLAFVLQPERRVFWGFLLSSVFLVLLTLKLQGKPLRWRYLKKVFFNRKYWLSKDTKIDISFLFLNSTLRLLILIPLVGSQLIGALWIAKMLQVHLGNAPEFSLSWWQIATIFSLCFFVAEDFSRFFLHRLMHTNRFLWQLHKVHHSAKQLSPLTLFRVHPLEMALYFFRSLLVFSLISGIFIYLFGGKLSGLDILGVDALGFLFNAIGANLRHSHIAMNFGKAERWLISPAQHQIHHSCAPEHRNKNFGTCLAVWDKLFNSHYLTSTNHKKLRFGIYKIA